MAARSRAIPKSLGHRVQKTQSRSDLVKAGLMTVRAKSHGRVVQRVMPVPQEAHINQGRPAKMAARSRAIPKSHGHRVQKTQSRSDLVKAGLMTVRAKSHGRVVQKVIPVPQEALINQGRPAKTAGIKNPIVLMIDLISNQRLRAKGAVMTGFGNALIHQVGLIPAPAPEKNPIARVQSLVKDLRQDQALSLPMRKATGRFRLRIDLREHGLDHHQGHAMGQGVVNAQASNLDQVRDQDQAPDQDQDQVQVRDLKLAIEAGRAVTDQRNRLNADNGGIDRGRPLICPDGDQTRPTADRARSALFNVLSHASYAPSFEGALILDLFAGTGALGLESLSRGAKSAVFVENPLRPCQR